MCLAAGINEFAVEIDYPPEKCFFFFFLSTILNLIEHMANFEKRVFFW